MRVLMLGWEYPPRVTGGLGTATAGIARALASAGIELTLVLPEGAGTVETGGVRIETVPAGATLGAYARPLDPYGGDLLAQVDRFAAGVRERASRGDFDLVHAHDWMTWPAAIAAKAASGRPWIAHVHSIEADRQHEHPHQAIEALEERGLAAADRVICVSRYAAERVKGRYGLEESALRVVHNAVDPQPATPREESVLRPLVLFLGRVTAQKGPRTFLQAAALVARLLPAARFVLAGEGEELPACRALAHELGLDGRVDFPGFIPPEERDGLFARASVFVLPSISEPFGIAPLEALAAGVPVVVSTRSGVSEVLQSCLRVEAGDPDALAEAIAALLRYPALARQLVLDGQRELEGLRWEGRGAQLRALFAELCA